MEMYTTSAIWGPCMEAYCSIFTFEFIFLCVRIYHPCLGMLLMWIWGPTKLFLIILILDTIGFLLCKFSQVGMRIITKVVSSNLIHGEVYSIQHYVIKIVSDKTDQWFSPGTPVSSTNRTDCHNITEILLKVALNTITLGTFLSYVSCLEIVLFYIYLLTNTNNCILHRFY
jgi:hypothetical protein